MRDWIAEVEENRFYEGICPPFPYEPTKDKFKIVETDDKGKGVISLSSFNPGEIIFVFKGKVVPEQTLMTLQIAPGKYLLDDRIMGKILHSCDPNMDCNMNIFTFTARKVIAPNEFLTMDYESTEDKLFRAFDCTCGTKNCRGYISGRQARDGA